MTGHRNLPAMPTRPSSVEAFGPDDPDYEAILNAVMETARGRWFLTEYARRNRTADTRSLLASLDRIETLMHAQRLPDLEQVRAGLADIIEALAGARREIAAHGGEDRERLRHQDVDFGAEAERGKADVQTIRRAGERIQEIAWGLREREVSPELCDALDRYAMDVLGACRSQDGTVRAMAAMARALRRVEGRIDALSGTLSEPESAPATKVSADIHKADPAAGRFLEDFELVDAADIQWTGGENGAATARQSAPEEPAAAEPVTGIAPIPEPDLAREPGPVREPRAAPAQPPAPWPGPPAAPLAAAATGRERPARPPSDLTGLTFDQRMILFS